MPAILACYDVCKFETCLNGFLDLGYPNFDPKHGFLGSIKAEIISFLPNKLAIFIFSILRIETCD